MEQAFTVTQVNNYIKNMFVKDYVLNRIYLKGEVSNCKYHSSGHIYFTLKDETGQMACVMFAGCRTGLTFHLEEGQSIIVFGNISVYERDGKYQMYAKEIRLDGLGLFYERFDILKQQLKLEGLFDAEHKKEIPKFAKRIGIVTAQTGAVIWDIMNVSHRRNPYVQMILFPAKVQGEGSAQTIVQGIKTLDRYGVDTIIIGRGGGSIEDLWAFNEEIVARAIYECNTPIISAIGHETDTTIADYVSDLRAPTPSAAAELAVNDVNLLESKLVDYHDSMVQAVIRNITTHRKQLEQHQLKLSYLSPMYTVQQKRQSLIDTEERMRQKMHVILEKKKHQFDLCVEKMKGLSPLNRLKNGFSFVTDEQGALINSIEKVKVNEILTISVTDGVIKARTEEITPAERG